MRFTLISIFFLVIHFSLFANRSDRADQAVPVTVLRRLPLELVPSRPFLSPLPPRRIARPTVGLALSGGALRGVLQIGVLKALEQHQIPIDVICATSIGSVVGGLYASGYEPDEIRTIFDSVNWKEILVDSPNRAAQFLAEKQKRNRAIVQFRLNGWKIVMPEAYTPGQKLSEFLINVLLKAPLHENNFSELAVPLSITATDLYNGDKVMIREGELAEAMRASSAVPLLLNPVNYQNRTLVDGGLLDNIPVTETRHAGADIVIAVNATANLRSKHELTAPWHMADQVTTIMQREHNSHELRVADLVIDFQDIESTSTDLAELERLFQEGMARTERIIPHLQQKLAAAPLLPSTSYLISGHWFASRRDTALAATAIDLAAPRRMTVAEVSDNLRRLFQTGLLDSCSADIVAVGRDTLVRYVMLPNPPLSAVHFHGAQALPDSMLQPLFASMLNQPVQHVKFRSACLSLLKLYRQKGYSLADITAMAYDSTSATAHLYIAEGTLSRIEWQGLQRTKPYVISREFTLTSGEPFRFEQAQQGIANLYGTGLFSSVSMRTQRNGPQWNLSLAFEEKKYHLVRWGARYDSERLGRTFVEWAQENLFGTGNELTLHSQYGKRDMLFALAFNANRMFQTYLTSQVNIHHDVHKNFYYENFSGIGEYERRSSGGTFSLGSQLGRFGTVWAVGRSERINIRSISGYGYDNGDLIINTIGVNTVVDTRDRMPFPSSGKYYTFFYELSSGKFLGGDISYFKVENILHTHYTFWRRNTLSQKLLWGTSDLTTPFSEQFRLGGADSFYGLREGELQGRHVISASWEYRYRLPWKPLWDMFFSMRFEVGAAWKNAVHIKAEDFVNGRGASLAMNTPAGPLQLSCGFASNNRKRLYVSLGHTF